MTEDKKKHDPFDPAQFRAPNTLDGSGDGIRREFTQILIGKPKKSSFSDHTLTPITGCQLTSLSMIVG